MVAEGITGAVVVAHSLSGVWAQLLLGAAPDRIARMVFLNAVVLRNGESFVSNAVGPAQASARHPPQPSELMIGSWIRVLGYDGVTIIWST